MKELDIRINLYTLKGTGTWLGTQQTKHGLLEVCDLLKRAGETGVCVHGNIGDMVFSGEMNLEDFLFYLTLPNMKEVI